MYAREALFKGFYLGEESSKFILKFSESSEPINLMQCL